MILPGETEAALTDETDYFRLAGYSGVDAIFVNKRAFIITDPDLGAKEKFF